MGDQQISRPGQEISKKDNARLKKCKTVEVVVEVDSERLTENESNVNERFNQQTNSLRDFIYYWALEVALNERKINGDLLPSFNGNSKRKRNDRDAEKKA